LNYLVCSFYSRSAGKNQRHWAPAFAGVTLFVVITLPIDLIAFLLDLMTYLFDTMAYKLSSRRKPESSVVRTTAINA
jgi:hypothetical protein